MYKVKINNVSNVEKTLGLLYDKQADLIQIRNRIRDEIKQAIKEKDYTEMVIRARQYEEFNNEISIYMDILSMFEHDITLKETK